LHFHGPTDTPQVLTTVVMLMIANCETIVTAGCLAIGVSDVKVASFGTLVRAFDLKGRHSRSWTVSKAKPLGNSVTDISFNVTNRSHEKLSGMKRNLKKGLRI
jgi:hypothetical protein